MAGTTEQLKLTADELAALERYADPNRRDPIDSATRGALHGKGLITPHPRNASGWKVTPAGRKALGLAMRHKVESSIVRGIVERVGSQRVVDALNHGVERNVAADAAFGREVMTLLEVADMTDPELVREILHQLIPGPLRDETIGVLAEAASANAPALAKAIREAFDMGGLQS